MTYTINGNSAKVEFDEKGFANQKQVDIFKGVSIKYHGCYLVLYVILAVVMGVITFGNSWAGCYYTKSGIVMDKEQTEKILAYAQDLAAGNIKDG